MKNKLSYLTCIIVLLLSCVAADAAQWAKPETIGGILISADAEEKRFTLDAGSASRGLLFIRNSESKFILGNKNVPAKEFIKEALGQYVTIDFRQEKGERVILNAQFIPSVM